MFLRAVFSMFVLQTNFFHVYHLKDDMQTTPKANPRIVALMLGRLQRRPCLRLLPTRATGSTLCVMGDRQRLLGHACSSYTCTGSALDVMDYGLARAGDSATH